MLIYHAINIRLFVSLRFDTQHKSFLRSKRRNTDVLCSVSSQTEFYNMKYIHVAKLSNRRWNIFLSSFHRDNLLIDYINQCGKHLNHWNASLKSIKLIYYYVQLCEWYFITGKRKRKIFTILLKPAEKKNHSCGKKYNLQKSAPLSKLVAPFKIHLEYYTAMGNMINIYCFDHWTV